jgi:hypothetical protein
MAPSLLIRARTMPYTAGHAAARARVKKNGDASLGCSHALLFYQLARFLVWAQQHQGIVAANPALREILGDTASLLENAGTPVENAGA